MAILAARQLFKLPDVPQQIDSYRARCVSAHVAYLFVQHPRVVEYTSDRVAQNICSKLLHREQSIH